MSQRGLGRDRLPGRDRDEGRRVEGARVRAATPARRRSRSIPSTVDVTVLNGSGRVLAAEDVAQALSAKRYRALGGRQRRRLRLHLERRLLRAGLPRAGAEDRRAPRADGHDRGARPGRGPRQRGGGRRRRRLHAGRSRPRRRPRREPPATRSTPPAWSTRMRSAQRTLGTPGDGAAEGGERLRRRRSSAPYRINAGRQGPAGGQDRLRDGRCHKYWGIEMTTMKNPPIVEGETGSYDSGGRNYLTYYDGLNLQRLAFQKRGRDVLDLEHACRTTSAPRRSRRSRSRCVR